MSLGRRVASADFQGLSINSFEQFLAGFIEPLRRLVVADLQSSGIEYFKAYPGFHTVFGIGE